MKPTLEEFRQTLPGIEETRQDLVAIYGYNKEKVEEELDKLILQYYNEEFES